MRRRDGQLVHETSADGTPVYRVRLWDPVLKKQIERNVVGQDEAKKLVDQCSADKRRPGRLQAERVRFVEVAERYLVAYRIKRDGQPRPKSSLAKERACLNTYLLPVLGNAWIGDLDLPDLNATIRGLTLQNGKPASGGHQEHRGLGAAADVRLGAGRAHHHGESGAGAAHLLGRFGPPPDRDPQHPAGAAARCGAGSSSPAWATWPWSWPSPACGGKKP
jgi:hypothetical protein